MISVSNSVASATPRRRQSIIDRALTLCIDNRKRENKFFDYFSDRLIFSLCHLHDKYCGLTHGPRFSRFTAKVLDVLREYRAVTFTFLLAINLPPWRRIPFLQGRVEHRM